MRLVLSTRVEDEFLSLRVTGPSGEVVSGAGRRDPRDARAIIAPVDWSGSGALTVRWRVLSEDGHPSGGAYALRVGGGPDGALDSGDALSDHGIVPVAARLLALAGPLGLIGLIGLIAGVLGPAVRAGGMVVPGEGPAPRAGFRERAVRALRSSAGGWWTAWWGLVAAQALGLALAPIAVLRGLRAGADDLGPLLGGTRFGEAWRLQVAGLVVAVAAALIARRALAPGWLPGPRVGVVLAIGPLAALAAISWGGHASAGGDAAANIVIDLLHSVATAAWIGGVLGLAVLVIPAAARLADGDRVRLGAAVVVRFSTLAMSCVAVLVVTGVYRALAEISIGRLADTGYGRVLLVKVGVFALLLCVGGYNRLVVHTRLERAALGLEPGDRDASSALRTSLRLELGLAAALLVCVALLASLAPPG